MNLQQHPLQEQLRLATRRHFLKEAAFGLGSLCLTSQSLFGAGNSGGPHDAANPLAPLAPSFAPSQMEFFDYKPMLAKYDGKDCPAEYLAGQRFAFIQGVLRLLGPQFDFKQHGQSGTWISDRLPSLHAHADKLCFINNEPAHVVQGILS
jgi:Protein of unknown function (DUF1501)